MIIVIVTRLQNRFYCYKNVYYLEKCENKQSLIRPTIGLNKQIYILLEKTAGT